MNFFDAKRPRSGIRNEFRPQSARPNRPPSKFFQNSATIFHALLALFLLLAATFPAFAQIPSKVTLSRANTPTADGFTVAWSDLSNETAYHLEHTTSANFTNSTLITNISANATSHALTGLTPGTTYYVRVRGAAAGGNGTWSDVQANQLLSLDPGQTRYLSVAGVPHGASHSVNFTISDIFGSANAAGLASGTTASEASTILLLGSNGSTAHTVFYNSSQNEWREGDTNKGSEVVGFGKGFIVKNNTGSADIFLLSGAASLNPGTVTVFDAGAPAGRLSLLSPSKATPTALTLLGLVLSDNTTTGLKRATTAKDADLILIPDNIGNLKRYHYDGTNWKSGLRAVSDPSTVSIPAGGAFFLRKASGSSFEQWTPPVDPDIGNIFLLDIEPAAAAFALRKLRKDYSGHCIRVRRASDNTTQNIGFAGNDLDVVALESFCSGTNGFVDLWYDQSGNGYNLAQTNLGPQPQIVSSGTVLTQSGKPTMEWDTRNAFLYFPSAANGVYQNKTYGEIAFCGRNTVTTGRRDVAAFQTNSTGFSRITGYFGLTTNNRLSSTGRRLDADALSSVTSSTNTTNTFAQFAVIRNWSIAEASVIENNITVASGASGTSGATSNTASYTANSTGNASGVGMVFATAPIKNISEVIFYNTDVSATQSERYTEMMNYYGL